MSTDAQEKWLEISRCLDEVLDLAEPARAAWLHELGDRSPTVARAVRSLLAEEERLAEEPLLSDEQAAAVARPGLAGQQIGAYTLESVLGHGGMGTVWLARRSDGRYEGHAAIKLLNAALLGRPTERRFVREGSLLAKLHHPNIAQLIDAGVAPSGQPYLVLEYVDGERIDRYAAQRSLDIEARVRLFLDVLGAVAYAHSHLIVHRDLKPSNILVNSAGVVKLLDFGIAALLGPTDTDLTREVDPGLTPEYAAPEQLLKQPVTTATDVYALGLVLFQLLAGAHPLDPQGRSRAELTRASLERDAPRLSDRAAVASHRAALRGDLDNIVAKALKKQPIERYSTADALAQDLRCFLGCQPVSARPDSLAYRAGKFARRRRGSVAAAAFTAVVLIGATVITTWQMLEARRQRDAALYQSKRAEFQSRFAHLIMSEVGDGGPVTIRQLMQKGVEVLEKNYGDDPRFVIGALISMSGRYMTLGDTNGEHAALVKAEGIARQLGDPDQIARVQCNTVETELAAGRPEQAHERMRDGLANLAKVSDPSVDRQTECGMAQARLLWGEGELPGAIEAATKIGRLMEDSGGTDDPNYTTIATMLQVMLAAEGRRHEAREWNRRYVAALQRWEGGSNLAMFTAQRFEASHLYDAGEVRAALEVQRGAVEHLAAQQGGSDSVPAGFAHPLGLYQVRLDETDAGLVWLDRGVAKSAAENQRRVQIAALLNRAQAHLLLGMLDRVLTDVESAERLTQENPREHGDALRGARFIRAQLLAGRGEPGAALAELDGILVELGYPQKRVANRLADILTLKAREELALGRNSAALITARDAYAIAVANAPHPERSASVGAALMAIAQAQRASGDAEGARASAKRAAAALSIGLGPDHSETRAALLIR